MTTYRQICVFLTGALGDFINALPALSVLRKANPASRIVLVGNPLWLPLAQADGRVDRVISMESLPLYAGFQAKLPGNHRLYRFLADFDMIISWFGDAEGQWEKTLRYISQNSHVFPLHQYRSFPGHISDYYLSTLKKAGMKHMPESPLPDLQSGTLTSTKNQDIKELVGNNRPYLCLHPGSGGKKKNWRQENFLAVAHTFYQQWKRPVLVLLGPAEADQKEYWGREKRPFLLILPDLSIIDAAYILSKAAIYAGNDSGMTHLAASLGVPIVALFGPTDPCQWAPKGVNTINILHQTPGGSPCPDPMACDREKNNCLAQITPEAALKQIERAYSAGN